VARRASAALAALIAIATLTAAAYAQNLPRLAVESFALSADTGRPQIDVPFRLIVTLRVRERVTQIDNLELPILAELELLGDERQTASGVRGTLYREIITVVARHAGTILIGPATLQAVDARDGKPKQWYTNGLTLRVGGEGRQILRNGARAVLAAAAAALHVVLWAAGVACVAAVAVLLFRRRLTPASAAGTPPALQPLAPPSPRSRGEQLQDALTLLRAEPTRAAAMRVRSAVWRMVGATDGETLGDVLGRPEASDTRMRELLIALERGAFTYDDDLRAAIEDACGALERSPQ
jgi:hypothetical protein